LLKSAGILAYRVVDGGFEVLLVHSNGREDLEPWSIPKGEFDPTTESPESAAVREVREEIGIEIPEAALNSLGESIYPNKRKRVTAFAWQLPQGALELNLDPREIAMAELFPFQAAKSKLHSGQVVFLDRLADWLRI